LKRRRKFEIIKQKKSDDISKKPHNILIQPTQRKNNLSYVVGNSSNLDKGYYLWHYSIKQTTALQSSLLMIEIEKTF
jgi:hypothetical protein